MEDKFDTIGNIPDDLLPKEASYADLKTLNKNIHNKDSMILYINIRSLNHDKLNIFVESFKVKPCVIVCTETWYLSHFRYLALPGYKIFYNNSTINKSDGVVLYIENSVNESTNIIEIGKL